MIMNDITEGIRMFDEICKIGESTIQHGKANNRVYLLDLHIPDISFIIPELDALAKTNGYTKIIAKVPSFLLPEFILNDYVVEAYVPLFYKGENDCAMVAKFLHDDRKQKPTRLLQSFSGLYKKGRNNNFKSLNPEFGIRVLTEKDAESASRVFREVFDSYPFPVFDPDYICSTIKNRQAIYYGIWEENNLVGISTAETNFEKEYAEMTDFAVLPQFRGNGFASQLLNFMEVDIKSKNIKTAYTIARIAEPGMNLTFIKGGYNYSGTLINNTNIGGDIESMNVFYKHI